MLPSPSSFRIPFPLPASVSPFARCCCCWEIPGLILWDGDSLAHRDYIGFTVSPPTYGKSSALLLPHCSSSSSPFTPLSNWYIKSYFASRQQQQPHISRGPWVGGGKCVGSSLNWIENLPINSGCGKIGNLLCIECVTKIARIRLNGVTRSTCCVMIELD